MTQRRVEYWVIPPQADAEFVAHMEQVLDLYQKPYDPNCPVVCMDEQPVQLVQETRPPMAATKNRPRRVDYEYERAGTAAVFLFSEPLAGWRQATARARRTKVDWALEVAGLLEGRYADCPKITLVCDHLNTHTKGAFYEVFEPARARELVRRIEFCHTPKHGSWLNIAENELSSMTRQCVRGRRIGDLGTLHDEVSAWSTDVNGTQRGVELHGRTDASAGRLAEGARPVQDAGSGTDVPHQARQLHPSRGGAVPLPRRVAGLFRTLRGPLCPAPPRPVDTAAASCRRLDALEAWEYSLRGAAPSRRRQEAGGPDR